MLDDLDLAWEEQGTQRRRGQPPSRQARQRRRKEAKRKRRSYGALIIALVLLLVLAGGVFWGIGWIKDTFGAADYEGNPGKTEVSVLVEPGDGGTEIGSELYEKKVVASVKAFVNAYENEPNSRTIQPGRYKLYEEMPAKVALSYLLNPAKYLLVNQVTIPEGKTMWDTYAILSKASGMPVADFEKAAPEALKKIPDYWFTRSDGKKPIKSLEGFLFPDTYRFDPEASAQDMLEVMVDQFLTVTGDLKFTDTVERDRGGLTPFEALTVASLAQVEALHEGDMGKVARVAYNRAFGGNVNCNCLQFDVTVNYWLLSQGKQGKASKDMLDSELDNPKNPWNTGLSSEGLPAGPISSPGKAALEGAMSPPKGDWIYFVAVDKKGTTKFTASDAEFEDLVAEARRNGVL